MADERVEGSARGRYQGAARNLSMVTDLYEMTMANGYFAEGAQDGYATFDVFYRQNPDGGGFAIFAGLEQVLDYLENMHFSEEDVEYLRSLGIYSGEFLDWLARFRFRGTVSAVPEGTVVYPNEPLVTVTAPVVDAQLVETALLAQVNHQSLIATKTQRIVRAAAGRPVSDFGARRAHNMDAAVYGARAAYIGGAGSTATVLAGQMFGIPVSGTMAHSWVMYHASELEAFERFARLYPDNSVLLIDTYDVLGSGLPNAVRTAHEVLEPLGKRLKGVRIDSGDLAYLSKEIRRVLDAEGLEDCMVVASNSLDEWTIQSLLEQGARLDSFGVGERLITARSEPVFGAVYKLVAVNDGEACLPKIKVSETFEKITNPGRKRLWRVYDAQGFAVADLITGQDEEPDFSRPYECVDPRKPWKRIVFDAHTARELHRVVMRDGRRTAPSPSLEDVRAYVRGQLDHETWPEEQRFTNPHQHYLDMSPAYYGMKMSLLEEASRGGQA